MGRDPLAVPVQLLDLDLGPDLGVLDRNPATWSQNSYPAKIRPDSILSMSSASSPSGVRS
jgi:hypothetical protein